MPLISPIKLIKPKELGPIHFIAIGGSGMNGVARVFAERGFKVSGSNQELTPYMQDLSSIGIDVHIGHDASHVNKAETVVISSAVKESNPELAEARKRGLRVWHRSAALASLMIGYSDIGITGTHGKTTTTGMVATVLKESGLDPSYVIGGILTSTGVSSAHGHGKFFVVEADESDGSFLQYPLETIVITNIDSDHLVNWGTTENYKKGFVKLAMADKVKNIILCIDDPGCCELLPKLRSAGKNITTYGLSRDADIRCTKINHQKNGSSMKLKDGNFESDINLKVHGTHNLINAAATYAVGRMVGLDSATACKMLEKYQGLHRRLEPIGKTKGIKVVDDYGHLPAEIEAALKTTRLMAGKNGRTIACFQPHLYTRTRDYAKEFGEVLGLADIAIVTDVNGAREDPMPGITGEMIVKEAQKAHPDLEIIYVKNKSDVADVIADIAKTGDIVSTHGCGDIYKYTPEIVEKIKTRKIAIV